MAVKVHGRKTALIIADIGAVDRDISQYCTNVDMPTSVDMAEITGFGVQDKEFLPGHRSSTLRIQGHWSKDANMVDALFSGLLGGGPAGTISSAFQYGPGGSANGDVKYSGTAYVSNYSRTSPIGGVVTFSADLQLSGSITRGTFS